MATVAIITVCVIICMLVGIPVGVLMARSDRVEKAIDHFGADFGINYREQDLPTEVKKLTDGRGADVVTDNIGDPELWQSAISSLASLGRIVTAGAHAGTEVTMNLKNLYLGRQRIIGSPGCNFSDVEWAISAAADGSIRAPIIDRIMPLHEAAAAHALVEGRGLTGKILLDPLLSKDQPT